MKKILDYRRNYVKLIRHIVNELLGFHITVPYAKDYKKIKMLQSARKALDFAQGID